MIDPRFYDALPPLTVADLARLTGARLGEAGAELAERRISSPASLADASAAEVGFCADRRRARDLAATAAGACFVSEELAGAAPSGCATLITPLPTAAWAAAAAALARPRELAADAPAIDPTAELEAGVIVGPGAVIGAGAAIGARSRIGPGAYVGPGVAIGRDCVIGAGVVVVCALVGDRVKLLSGAVIGESGFGATLGQRGVIDIPQLGRVILQDGVTIGANSCVDRGALGDTVVGENTKIDNLVQIAHNVVIGRNCVLAAHTGVSGSVTIGDGCQLGGRVGIADHITIGPGARLAASSGVMSHIPAGETWGGTPARPMARWMREAATLARLARKRPGADERS